MEAPLSGIVVALSLFSTAPLGVAGAAAIAPSFPHSAAEKLPTLFHHYATSDGSTPFLRNHDFEYLRLFCIFRRKRNQASPVTHDLLSRESGLTAFLSYN